MPFDFSERFRLGSSPIHQLDPRAKVASALLFILSVNLIPDGSWGLLAACLLGLFAVVRGSGVGIGNVARRSWAALPFVLAALAIPFTTPGAAVAHLPLVGWALTDQGLIRFASLLLRFWIAIQTAILLAAVTPFPDLLWALGRLRLPAVLVSIIGFMYRYLFVIGEEAGRMLRARSARCARGRGRLRPSVLWQARIAGLMVGSLFLRALARSERIHAAMMSRGYDGSFRTLVSHHLAPMDWMVLSLLALLLAAVGVWRVA